MNANNLAALNPTAGQSSPLDQLADIHLPPPVASFPWAPGWWLVIGAVIIATLAAGLYLRHYRRKNAFRRAALAELITLNAVENDREFAQQLNQLLRRVALHSYTNKNIAGLSGDKWMDFLYQSCGDKPAFTDAAIEAMLNAAYQPAAQSLPRDVLIAESTVWIKRHRSHHV